MAISQLVAVFFAGLLAGEELIVRYGVHPALNRLDTVDHIRARQALIDRLKIVVPVMFALALVSSVVGLVVSGGSTGLAWRIAGVAALVVWALSTFLGTVRINSAVVDWVAENPPADWKEMIARWGRIDILRSSAATLAFAFLAIGLALPSLAN